jgi:hypothetical protein
VNINALCGSGKQIGLRDLLDRTVGLCGEEMVCTVMGYSGLIGANALIPELAHLLVGRVRVTHGTHLGGHLLGTGLYSQSRTDLQHKSGKAGILLFQLRNVGCVERCIRHGESFADKRKVAECTAIAARQICLVPKPV